MSAIIVVFFGRLAAHFYHYHLESPTNRCTVAKPRIFQGCSVHTDLPISSVPSSLILRALGRALKWKRETKTHGETNQNVLLFSWTWYLVHRAFCRRRCCFCRQGAICLTWLFLRYESISCHKPSIRLFEAGQGVGGGGEEYTLMIPSLPLSPRKAWFLKLLLP